LQAQTFKACNASSSSSCTFDEVLIYSSAIEVGMTSFSFSRGICDSSAGSWLYSWSIYSTAGTLFSPKTMSPNSIALTSSYTRGASLF